MVDTNPEIDQDRVDEASELFRKHGYAMFPQQRAIYCGIACRVIGKTILEAGCGCGLGTAVLNIASDVEGTDKLPINVAFAKELYPWIPFSVWDINQKFSGEPRQAVVAVEVLEHVHDPVAAMQNLLDAATECVWLSTPNGEGKPQPPDNPFHVREYTAEEITNFIGQGLGYSENVIATFYDWETFKEGVHSDPLVLRITK